MASESSDAQRIEAQLRASITPLTIDAIARAVFGRAAGERERGAIRVALHRLDARGVLVKHAMTYAIKTPAPRAPRR